MNRHIFEHLSKFKPTDEQESLISKDAKRKLLHLCIGINFSHLDPKLGLSTDFLIEIIDKILFHNKTDLDWFFSYYKNEICNWICKRHDSVIKYILSKTKLNFAKVISLLVSLMEFISSDKHLRKTTGIKIVQILYQNWFLFNDFWQTTSHIDTKMMLVDLLTKSILVDSSLFEKDFEIIKHVVTMYTDLLTDPKSKLGFKCKLLDLLHFFSQIPSQFSIKNCMGQFLANLPLKSSELVKGEDAYVDYVNAVRKILESIELCGSFELVNVIVGLITREDKHICDEEAHACFTCLMSRLETVKQGTLINFFWDSTLKQVESVSYDQRKILMFEKVFFVFLCNCNKPTFLEFLCANIVFLINILDIDLNESSFEIHATNKKSVFKILELAYRRLHKDEIFFSSAKLSIVYETNKFGSLKDGKELTKEVLRKCRKYLIEEVKFISNTDPVKNEKLLNLQRQMHCSAYNCLVALFVRTQTEPKLYIAFLFKDDNSKV